MSILQEHQPDVLVLSVLCVTLCLVYLGNIWNKRRRRNLDPTSWPIIGMLPALLQNVDRIHDYLTELLKRNGGTYVFKGPWFSNMDMFVTCDPANVNHILSKNFKNYPKGPHFQKIFDVLGDGVVNTDSELWELHRKTTMPVMNHPHFRSLLEKNITQKMENSLFPILDHYAKLGANFDLKQIFGRLAFDIACLQFLDKDSCSLIIGDDIPFLKSIREAVNAILYRHILPEWCWKLQKWVVGVDREKKLSQSGEAFDQFIHPILLDNKKNQHLPNEDSNFSVLISHMNAHQGKSMQFLRDTFLTLIIAGSDTTGSTLTWLFWLLAKHPLVEAKILDEILQLKPDLFKNGSISNKVIFKVEDCNKLIYLHAAISESLRLYPSVPLNHKLPTETDILPSGHVVKPNTKIIMPFYSMGRMASVWGDDCMEFKPERWITSSGGIKHQPSYKFPAFNAGPRSCIGRDMAFTVVKMVAATVLCRYQYQLVEPHRPVQISDSILLEKKHGLKVVFKNRN